MRKLFLALALSALASMPVSATKVRSASSPRVSAPVRVAPSVRVAPRIAPPVRVAPVVPQVRVAPPAIRVAPPARVAPPPAVNQAGPKISRPSAPAVPAPQVNVAGKQQVPAGVQPQQKQVATSPRMSEADKALKNKVAMQGGPKFKTRADAVSSFRAQHATEYNTHFNVQPSVRPIYIPSTYRISNGAIVNIVYDPFYRGYGYYNQGRWFEYDLFMDMVMLEAVLNQPQYQQQYAYAPPVVVATGVPVQGVGGGTILVVFLIVIGVVVVVAILANRASS